MRKLLRITKPFNIANLSIQRQSRQKTNSWNSHKQLNRLNLPIFPSKHGFNLLSLPIHQHPTAQRSDSTSKTPRSEAAFLPFKVPKLTSRLNISLPKLGVGPILNTCRKLGPISPMSKQVPKPSQLAQEEHNKLATNSSSLNQPTTYYPLDQF